MRTLFRVIGNEVTALLIDHERLLDAGVAAYSLESGYSRLPWSVTQLPPSQDEVGVDSGQTRKQKTKALKAALAGEGFDCEFLNSVLPFKEFTSWWCEQNFYFRVTAHKERVGKESVTWECKKSKAVLVETMGLVVDLMSIAAYSGWSWQAPTERLFHYHTLLSGGFILHGRFVR